MTKRKLPIGIQTFRTIREGGYYYVDKTGFIRRLVDEGSHYFLSRPRRFGKSLFLDTLKELFQGNQALFEGLDIHSHWDWSVRHPVVRLSFGGGNFTEPGQVNEEALAQLEMIAEDAEVPVRYDTPPSRLRHLLHALHQRTGQRVAVLVDEYDKPMLDALDTPNQARANREALRALYSTIKDCDEHIRFAFLTGVSQFSKVSVFSGLNNLTDLTLDPPYSAICGYTDGDLNQVFGPELPGLDRDAVRDWYNGYNWLGEERVYNPFDILQLFRSGRFKAYWFETGTPAFLVDTLLKRGVPTPSLDGLVSTHELLSAFDVDTIRTEALLFQTGYLTIAHTEDRLDDTLIRLGYPNREVRQSLNQSLLTGLLPNDARLEGRIELVQQLASNDFTGLEDSIRALFASIPHNWHVRNDIANYEGYYASVFYSHFAATGLDIRVEDASSSGRLDMVVRSNGNLHLFEFKVVERAPQGAAMAQLKEKRYAEKYRAMNQPVHLIAVEFSREQRNLVSFAVEEA